MHLSRCDCFKYIIHILLFCPVGWLYLKAAEYQIIIFLLQADIFQEFTLKEDLVGFQLNLTVLLDCLNIFGMSAVPGKRMSEMSTKRLRAKCDHSFVHFSSFNFNAFWSVWEIALTIILCCRIINSPADVLQGIWLPTDPVSGGGWSRDCVQDQHTRTRGANWLWLLQHQCHKQGGLEIFHHYVKHQLRALIITHST